MSNITDLGLTEFAGTDLVKDLPAELNTLINGIIGKLKAKVQSGFVTVTPSGVNVYTFVHVNFATAYKAGTTPNVVVSMRGTPGSGLAVVAAANNITNTGFDCGLERSSTTATELQWVANGDITV